MRRFAFTIVSAACLAALASGDRAFAQPPHAPPRARATPDTTWVGAMVRHGWIEAGYGWATSPASLRRGFEPAQGFAAGVEARPRSSVRLRAGADYQTLVASGEIRYEQLPGGLFPADTTTTDLRTRAWSLGLHAEAGWRAPGGVWLLAGGGPEYLDGGLDHEQFALDGDILVTVPGMVRDGWGWTVSLGAARSLQPLFQWPVGLGVHWRSFRGGTGDDGVQTWTIRVSSMRP